MIKLTPRQTQVLELIINIHVLGVKYKHEDAE